MSKRASGPPRRPRNPIAKAVRAPLFRQRVVPDKRRQERLPTREEVIEEAEANTDKDDKTKI